MESYLKSRVGRAARRAAGCGRKAVERGRGVACKEPFADPHTLRTMPIGRKVLLTADGGLDPTTYDTYRKRQERANQQKINRTSFVPEDDIKSLATWVRIHANTTSRFGICHGSRRGSEQRYFADALGWPRSLVIGTEISSTALRFENTVQHDFHEVRDEWLGRAAFIYSNALDHSYNPRKAIAQWLRCLSPGGVIIIEHTRSHNVQVGMRGRGKAVNQPEQVLRSKLPVADLWSGSFGTYIREISGVRGAEVVDVLPCATRQQDNRVNGNFGAMRCHGIHCPGLGACRHIVVTYSSTFSREDI